MSAVILDGAVVHYETWGRGRPLLLLHGWLGSWRYWMRTMEALATDYRAYAFDFWGFGDSAKGKSLYSILSYVQLVSDFMDQMGLRSTPIIGHSVGGAVATILASRRPERVERLILVACPLQASAINGRLRSFSNPVVSQLVWRPDADASIKRLLGSFRIDHAEVTSEAGKTDPEAISESMRSLAAIDLAEEVRRIHIPTLAVFGNDDPIVQVSQAAVIESASQRARAIIMDGVKHFPMLDEPVKFHRLLRDLLIADESLENLQLKEMWHRRTR
jgi:pimeloyl-ACP methyl ester carboxylesterase